MAFYLTMAFFIVLTFGTFLYDNRDKVDWQEYLNW